MDYTRLSHIALFDGIDTREIEQLLTSLGAHERAFSKGETVLRTGDTARYLGIGIEGSGNIAVNYYWGAHDIFVHVEPDQMFGEAYAVTRSTLLVDAVAAEPSTVLLMDADRLLNVCERSCRSHHRVIQNLVRIGAQKNIAISRRIMHTAPKTIRERVLSYLAEQAMEHESRSFTIPFSREQMASYLSVDRSALSNELSKMQRDGLIRFKKNRFELLGR